MIIIINGGFSKLAKSFVENEIDRTLKIKRLAFDKTKENGLLQYSINNLCEKFTIMVTDDFVSMKLVLHKDDDVKKMNSTLYRLGWKFKDITYSKNITENFYIYTIDIYPFSKKPFLTTLEDVCAIFEENKPQTIQSIGQTPKEFFVNEYKSFIGVPDEEKAAALEAILIIKEKYFKQTRTLKGIKNKLFQLKEEALSDADTFDVDEFFLLDFAALLRVLELNLLKFSLNEFFDNFKGEMRK